MVVVYDGVFTKDLEEKYQSHFQCISHELSDFQKFSIKSIIDGDDALVMAKTGCGKTVAAEFAIQYFVNQGKQVIYTSPIKALSNQQFYTFSRKYPSISFGIFTGDIQFNPNASVIFATAEIINNFFSNNNNNNNNKKKKYDNDNKIIDFQMDTSNLGCIIMDEVQYVLNKERGYVWENTILMLPNHVQMVMLSATLDNPIKFASWCETSSTLSNPRQVAISLMTERIVPLIHYSYLTTTESNMKRIKYKKDQCNIRKNINSLKELKIQDNDFINKTYYKIKEINHLFELNNVHIKRANVINKLLGLLKKDDLLPAILFAFSRKNVEKIANEITVNLLENNSLIPFNIREEAFQLVKKKLPNYQEYMDLPEYNDLMKLLEKGIGIHHSGMIPILREIVEIFVLKKYIKVLVATSSFSIGLDCAIRSTVFTSLKQYDGTNECYLLPHDYSQMSGRCGRRNIDVQGYVIHCNNLFQPPSLLEYKTILSGNLQKLQSPFHISYHIILNHIHNNNNIQSIIDFIQKSMINQDIIVSQQKNYTQSFKKMSSYEKIISSLKTPIEKMEEYYLLSCSENKNKKQKETERKMVSLLEEYKTCLKDTNIYIDYLSFKKTFLVIEQEQNQQKNVLFHQIQNILKILNENDFLSLSSSNELDVYTLTQKGQMARYINEIHPFILIDSISDLEYLSVKELIGIFSCFTNIRLQKDKKQNELNENESIYIKKIINDITKKYDYYENIEKINELHTGTNYKTKLMYDIFIEIQLWVDATDEISYKMILKQIQSKGISVGDFSKAILKICAITKEFILLYENDTESSFISLSFYQKLIQIDSLLLKFVCTNQSLYI